MHSPGTEPRGTAPLRARGQGRPPHPHKESRGRGLKRNVTIRGHHGPRITRESRGFLRTLTRRSFVGVSWARARRSGLCSDAPQELFFQAIQEAIVGRRCAQRAVVCGAMLAQHVEPIARAASRSQHGPAPHGASPAAKTIAYARQLVPGSAAVLFSCHVKILPLRAVPDLLCVLLRPSGPHGPA